jgi:zinc and cadmium transporter
MNTLTLIILATTLISLGSLVGVFTISLNQKVLQKFLLNLVALSAGTLLAGAFLHLLPESIEQLGNYAPFPIALFSFIGFFLIEKVLQWRHCHDEEHCEEHTLGYMNLIGDMIHNLLDGLIIAGAFATSPSLGWATTTAIVLHEVPQEISDFGVLLHSGFTRKKALLLNLMVGLSSIIGGLLGYFATSTFASLTPYILPVAAGGFIYISASDLIPEMKKDTTPLRTLSLVLTFLLGVALMAFVRD